jgi:hypothetical protein
LLGKEKEYAETNKLPAPAWSSNLICEELLCQYGPTTYNQTVKKCNLLLPRERTKQNLPAEGLSPYLDLASKHWRSVIVTKENSKRAYVVLADENPDSTEGEGEEFGILVCAQAFFSFLARLPPNKELTKVYLRFADQVDYLMRLGGRHHFVSRALTYAVFQYKMNQFDENKSAGRIDWPFVQLKFRENFRQMLLTNDFEMAAGAVDGSISKEAQADSEGNITREKDRLLEALYGTSDAALLLGKTTDGGETRVTFDVNFPLSGAGSDDEQTAASPDASVASQATGASGYLSLGSRITRALGIGATRNQLRTEHATLGINRMYIAHKNNSPFLKLLKSLGGSLYQIDEKVSLLFEWMNILIPGGGVTAGSKSFRDSRGSIKYDT